MGRPPKDPNREDTQVLILHAAEKAFAQHGYAHTRLADIAAAVGIRRPSLLYHFGSKQALYDAVVRDAFLRVGAALLEALDSGGADPSQRVGLVVGAMTGFARGNKATIGIVVREIIDPSEVGGPLVSTGLGGLVDSIMQGVGAPEIPGIDAREAALALISNYLLRTASQEPATSLWGPRDQTLSLANRLLLPG